MTVARLAVSFDAKLARAVRKAAGTEAISSWLADAARRKLQSEGLLALVQEWEAEHGALTEGELRAARREMRRRAR
jgi:hypothetical protein